MENFYLINIMFARDFHPEKTIKRLDKAKQSPQMELVYQFSWILTCLDNLSGAGYTTQAYDTN